MATVTTPESLTASGTPARSALASRSMAAVDRIVDVEQRRRAFARHMAEFPPLIANY